LDLPSQEYLRGSGRNIRMGVSPGAVFRRQDKGSLLVSSWYKRWLQEPQSQPSILQGLEESSLQNAVCFPVSLSVF
jgi:hypothetical protein